MCARADSCPGHTENRIRPATCTGTLGSIDTITNGQGLIVDRMSYCYR